MDAYAECLFTDPRTAPNLRLASAIASGAMHKHSTIYCLLRYLGEKAMNVTSGRSRTNSSVPKGIAVEDANEAAFFLCATLRDKDGMIEYGRNPKTVPSVQLSHPLLPQPYMSILDNVVLQQCAQRALERCSARFGRCFILVHDETVHAPGCGGSKIHGKSIKLFGNFGPPLYVRYPPCASKLS